ncbi:23S rRNA (guanosine(2251)-2'-O)-methyltransferase RlmB [Pseudoclavibacter soli]|uniref:23S rRNA (guanosine(2251)-2'-O)-methyltransferase RlmB n=1 Tax=Pseudoclavibacter soli TaxID=452623 RepID=UPI0004136891|nr:23S rRNA (guanosine(2251)-2'-O)-methyltransferase RlmB [Pseudoclavibacter soli]
MAERKRAGAVRKHKKGPLKGSGGQRSKGLEGRGPTPKAEDRPYHAKAKAKARAERSGQQRGGDRPRRTGAPASTVHKQRTAEVISGRNAVAEALAARVPATALYVADHIEADDRVRDALARATQQRIPVLTAGRTDLDRLVGEGAVHQGIALQIPPYRYASVDQLLEAAGRQAPLLVALDGVTDPRNLGAIIRSVAAFGGHGVIVPERRSAGVTASAWKTSAGAALRTKVAMVPNLTQTLRALKKQGLFVIGLDGGGEVSLPDLQLGAEPLVVVVGSEGDGLSRLVRETCDEIVSIPITASTESLNAGIAAAVALYGISVARQAG